VIDAFRTPEERFDGLPDFAYEPHYRTVGELRLAHLDVGEGAPVLMLHGEPSWSFIWRKVIPVVRDAGYRCVVPDHAGFGRSDKPTDLAWHSLGRHIELTSTLVEDLDLRDATVVCHDWGGPIGLSVALAYPKRIARFVILDTVIDPREAWMSDLWVRFREFVEAAEDLPIGELIRGGLCYRALGDDVVSAYEAPFPTLASKAAVWGLPMSVPRSDDSGALAASDAFLAALRNDVRPKLMLWGERDLLLTLGVGQRLAASIGHQIDYVIPDAGHALQEDQGPMIGELIAGWLLGGA